MVYDYENVLNQIFHRYYDINLKTILLHVKKPKQSHEKNKVYKKKENWL